MIGLLVVDPWLARDYGFALSVLATAGLLVLAGPLAAALGRVLPRSLALVLAVPIAAQLACQPVLLMLESGAAALRGAGEPARRAGGAARDDPRARRLPRCSRCSLVSGPRSRRSRGCRPAGSRRSPGSSRRCPARRARGRSVRRASLLLVVVTALGDRGRAARRPDGCGGWLERSPPSRSSRYLASVGGIRIADSPRARPTGSTRRATSGRVTPSSIRSGDAIALIDTGPEPEPLRALPRRPRDRSDRPARAHALRPRPRRRCRRGHRSRRPRAGRSERGCAGRPHPSVASRRPVRRSTRSPAGRGGVSGLLDWRVVWPPPSGVEPGNAASVTLLVTPGAACASACLSALLLGDLGEESQARLLGAAALGPVDVVKVAHHGSADQSDRLYEVVHAPGRPDRSRRRQRLRPSDRPACSRSSPRRAPPPIAPTSTD